MQQKKTRAPIKNEAKNGLKNKRGNALDGAHQRRRQRDLAVLRQTSSTMPSSITSRAASATPCRQGQRGMDVIDKIAARGDGPAQGHDDVPKDDIVVESARIPAA